MKNKQTFTFSRAAMTLLLMMLTTATTWADNYVPLTSSTKTWKNNTYVTNGNVTIEDRITVEGNVTLILTDGYTLTAPNGIEVRVGNSLTIKGGTNGTGTLTIEKNDYSKAGIGGGYLKGYSTQYGDITIDGGIVNVKGGAYSAGIGGNDNSSITGCGTITINGGIVNATGGTKAAGIGGGRGSNKTGAYGGCGKIVINGGQVTATGGDEAPGIGPGKDTDDNTSGLLVLGWTNTSDFIKVTSGNSSKDYGFSNRLDSISFADGKKFNISGGGEATIKNIKSQVSLTLIPKGSEQHQLSVATISGINASYDLTGSYLDIPFSVSDAEENTLTLGTDYTATLGTIALNSASIHITEGGKYTLTITGMGSYAGSKSVDFEVVSIGFKKDANGVDYINMPKTGIYYDAKIPSGVSSFNVYDDGGAKAQYSNSYDGGLVLTAPDNHVLQLTGTVTAEVWGKELRDYLMVYDGVYDGVSTSAQKIGDKYGSDESGENIGTLISSGKQMTLTFHSDPSGQRDGLDLKVTLKRDIMSCDIANIDDQTYTGSAFEPAVVITYKGTALVKDEDYEVTYSDKTIVGTATITITGKGNYAGTTSKTFNIVKATPTVTAPAVVENLIYTGGSLNLVAAGTTDFGTLLYSLDGESYSADIPTGKDAGTYTIYYKVEGSSNWDAVDAASVEATIMGKNIATCDITVPNQPTNNNLIFYWFENVTDDRIHETVKDGETTLTLGTDYSFGSVYYSDMTGMNEPGKIGDECLVEIIGKRNYAGTAYAPFKIVAPDAGGKWGDNDELTWAFHDGTLTISPTENVQTPVAMKKAAKGGYPWFSVANYINTITIEEGVSTVAANAFNRVTESNVYGNVNALNLPSTLTTIGEYAFAYCTGLTVELKDFAGITYPANAFTQVGCVVGTLLDNADNANTISVMEVAATNNVTLQGRTLYKDGEWNTICLPFDLSAEQIAASPLAGCALQELFTGETGFDASTGTLTLNFKDVTAIDAGRPYLIKWESGDAIVDPVFTGVSVSSYSHDATSNDGKVKFCGIYKPVELEAGDKSIFYLGANNQLYWPSKARNMNAFRAYFRVSGGYNVREIRMNLGDDVTGVTLIDNGQLTIDNYSGATYNLSGQKVSDDYKGIVIKNGKKIAK